MKFYKKLLVVFVLLGLGACAPSNNGSSSNSSPTEVTGYAQSTQFNQVPLVNGVDAHRFVTINVPLAALPNLGASSLNHAGQGLSKLPGTTLAFKKDGKGNNYLTVTVPVESLAKAHALAATEAAAALPNGNALPGFAGTGDPAEVGSLPLGNITLTLYLSSQAFGVFASGPFSLPMDASFPITDSSGGVVGVLASVAPQPGYDGGFFVSFVFPPAIVSLIGGLGGLIP